jgi:hypothetical protein
MQYLDRHYNLVARTTLPWTDVPRTVKTLNFTPTILFYLERDTLGDFP